MSIIFQLLEIYFSSLKFQTELAEAILQKQKSLKGSMDGRTKKGKGTRKERLLAKMTNCYVMLERVDCDNGVKVNLGEIQKNECLK